MSRIAGRRPNASGQMITAGMRAGRRMDERRVAGAVGRLDVDVGLDDRKSCADAEPAAAAMPAASDSATKSRRDRSFDWRHPARVERRLACRPPWRPPLVCCQITSGVGGAGPRCRLVRCLLTMPAPFGDSIIPAKGRACS